MFGGKGGERGGWDLSIAVGAPLLVLYAFTATRTVQGGDAGEFVLLAGSVGVAHPPGYPLYVLLSRLFALLPVGPLPFRVALLSAVAGVGSALVLALVLQRLTGRRLAAAAAGLAFGMAPVAWKLAGVPEVFTVNTLLVGAVIWVVVRWRGVLMSGAGSTQAAFLHTGAAALFAGLGLANHHTVVLALPFGVWAVGLTARYLGGQVAVRSLAAGALGLLIGLLPYLYLPIAAQSAPPTAWVWGDSRSAAALLGHVLRREYGTFSLGLYRDEARPLANLAAFWGALPVDLLVVYFVAGLWGVIEAALRFRGLALALGASLLLAGGLFLSVFNLPPGDLAAAVAERFHLLPLFLFAPFVGLGVAAASERLRSRLVPVAALLPLPFMLLAGIDRANWRNNVTVERYLTAALKQTAPSAVILGVGDAELFGFPVLLRQYRVRPDVRYIDVNLLRKAWYHRRARALTPELRLPFDAQRTNVAALVADLAAQVPTYLTPQLAGLARRIPLYPEGLLLRVRSGDRAAPAPETLEPAAERAFRDLLPLPVQPREAWSRDLRTRSAEIWALLARAYEKAGRATDAARCRERAAVLVGDI
jgi:hypothetical protein